MDGEKVETWRVPGFCILGRLGTMESGQHSRRESRSPPAAAISERMHRTVGGEGPRGWTNSGRSEVSTSNGIGNHAMEAARPVRIRHTPCMTSSLQPGQTGTGSTATHTMDQWANGREGKQRYHHRAEPRPVIARRSSEVLPRCTRASSPGPRSHPSMHLAPQADEQSHTSRLSSELVPCNQRDRGPFFLVATGWTSSAPRARVLRCVDADARVCVLCFPRTAGACIGRPCPPIDFAQRVSTLPSSIRSVADRNSDSSVAQNTSSTPWHARSRLPSSDNKRPLAAP